MISFIFTNIKKLTSLILLGALTLSPLYLFSQKSVLSPKQVVEEIYTLLQRYDDKAKNYHKDRERINDHFLLEAMAYDAISDHWGSMTAQQKKTYNQLMTKLLLKTVYEDTGDKLSKGTFVINKERTISSTRSIVLTKITVTKNNLKIANDYVLTKQKNGTYKVREILIDNANVAMDYKSQFNQIVPEYGIDSGKLSLFSRIREALEKNENWNEVGEKKESSSKDRKRRPTLLEK